MIGRRTVCVSLVGAGVAAALRVGTRTSVTWAASPPAPAVGALGPLSVHPANPRYFTDGSDRAVYLTGSHTWANLQDRGTGDPPSPFDFAGYLRFLREHQHNFIRLWAWEQAEGAPWTRDPVRFRPFVYRRTGPGTALDGHPRFDLTKLDPAYFERLRRRAVMAQQQGIYVAVMLFQGWSVEKKRKTGNPWPGHPLHARNNVNGVDGDMNGDGEGHEVHTLANPAVTALQKAYVRKVVDTLNDLDNVLWEISNESHLRSTEWQYEMIRFIREYEATLPQQHLIGMTAQYPNGPNEPLFESPAEWISPNHTVAAPYRTDPPVATGQRIVVSDTDHLWGVGGDGAWVWKSFTRGLHTIYMDPYDAGPNEGTRRPSPSARRAMGDTLRWSRRINLAGMTPRPDLASSRFCLAQPGREYLVYSPFTRSVIVDLSAVETQVVVEWFSPGTGETRLAGTVAGRDSRFLTSPFTGDSVLYLSAVER